MSSNQITADGPAEWVFVTSDSVHVAVHGTFGGGTVKVEQEVNGVVSDLLDSQAAITSTANDDYKLNLGVGDKIRLIMSGSTTPVVNWSIGGTGKLR